MNISELITAFHLGRQALIYIRQSSHHQVLNNRESQRLQYDLRQRACEYGWDPQDVEIIDADLGKTGSTAVGREGLKELITRVTLGQVGIIFSYDVTRLSRNCTEWYQLLDLCGYRHVLIGDRDGIYDPSTPNGRLLLGLKGQISELELHTLRGRLIDGVLKKAHRGELALALPIGLVRDPLGQVVKHPDREVQGRIDLIFATFLRLRSIAKVVRSFKEQDLLIPRRDSLGDVAWKKPSVAGLGSTLKNPAYAGAFVYGRTRSVRTGPDQPAVQKLQPMAEWRIRIPDKYPAYIDWATYEKIQAMIRDNYSEYDRNRTRGVPRPGKALLHGIVSCGECGHQMVVQYKPKTHYICNYLRQQHQVPVCQYLPADPIDDHVVQLFFAALAPAELDIYERVLGSLCEQHEQINRARQHELVRLRYQARLAERQFQNADPDNRLVAAEVEKRWEIALRELKRAEEALAREGPQPSTWTRLDSATRQALSDAGRKIPEWWAANRFSQEQKKALLRCLIDKVVVHRSAPDTVHCRVVWKGGDLTEADLAVTVGALARLSGSREMEDTVVRMTEQGKTDAEIACELTQQGYRSPKDRTVLPSTVRFLRLSHGLLRDRHQSHPRRISGFLTVSQIAVTLNIPRHWIYDRIHNGTIAIQINSEISIYLFPDTPETLAQFQQLRAGKLNNLRF
jgi:DNA invertase Pin-like site-specific DNA recombinase